MASRRYWVVGGLYTNTQFMQLAPGRKLERIGPFPTREAAQIEWSNRSWTKVDDCLARYAIVEETPETAGV